MPTSKLTTKGQVTIPINVREHLAIKPGDAIEFVVLDNGTVVVKPAYIDVMDLDGFLARPKGKRLSILQMKEVVKKRAVKQHAGN